MTKLTKGGLTVLRLIAARAELGQVFSRHTGGTRRDVLRRLEQDGFVTSAPPFAGDFHSVSLTDAGRKALQETP